MMQRKGRSLLIFISVALLFATVFGDEETEDGNQHSFHSTSVKHKDGSTSDSVSSSTTGKLSTTKGAANSLPEFLRGLNIPGLNIRDPASDPATSASSVNPISIDGGGNVPPFAGYHYPQPPYPPPGPNPPPFTPFIPGGGGEIAIFKIVEKVILVIGGGLLLLLIMVILKGAIAKGGVLNNFGVSLSKAFSGAVAVDAGPIHLAGAGSAALVKDPNFNRKVVEGTERRF